MTRLLLSLSSVAPLVGIVAIRLIGIASEWAVGLGIISVLLMLFLPVVFAARRRIEARPMTIRSIRDESAQVPAYLLTYVFPFAFATIDSSSVVWAYAVFGVLLLVLLLRTELSSVNPALLAVGVHSYSVVTEAGQTITLMARKAPLPGSGVLAHQIAGGVFSLSSIVEGDVGV